MRTSGLWVVLVVVQGVGCSCQPPPPASGGACNSDSDCITGEVCADGTCVPDGVSPDGGLECDPALADNATRDTDCDGLSDAEEFTLTYNGRKTDPCVADTDHDGLTDGLEAGKTSSVSAACTFAGDQDPSTKTDPTNPDTDGDGATDGQEDANHNGRVDPGEAAPVGRSDSDCDGISDGDEVSGKYGCASDPAKADTDGDGIPDPVEEGLATTAASDPACTYPPAFDLDPATKTNACSADSDGDQIADGAEDSNQNGKIDPGELNPSNPADATGPAKEVCTAAKLRPVAFRMESEPDLYLGLPNSFDAASGGELATMSVGGVARGVIGFDPTNQVAFLAFKQAAPAGSTTPAQDEAALRTTLQSVGALTNPTTQSFTSWDGYAALQAFYEQAGGADVKSRANALANALVGTGAGALAGSSTATGPFRLQAEVVHRSAQSVVVVLALTPTASFVEPGIFVVGDTAGGSALAQFSDAHAVQCEVFAPGTAIVDFLLVVDDSCSMNNKQMALAAAGDAVSAVLNNSSLDWRIAMATTDYHLGGGGNQGVLRAFTRNINEFKAWLTQNSACGGGQCSIVSQPAPCNAGGGTNGGCWVDTSGSGSEGSLGAARKAVDDITPGTSVEQASRLRQNATLVVVILGDADDQTTSYTTTKGCGSTENNCTGLTPVNDFIQFFNATGATSLTRNKLGIPIAVHGIVCPDTGQGTCGEFQMLGGKRHVQVITATGGVRGAILPEAGIAASINQIIGASIAAVGHKTQKPPIGASLKLAMDAVQNPVGCGNINDIPRSRVNGFDVDGLNQTVSLFGACRASASTTQAAISYRYWIDKGSSPDGCACPAPKVCDSANQCICPANCGGCAPGETCDPVNCQCVASPP